MNYGLTQMAQGRYQTALVLFEQAALLTPTYPLLEINLGIAKGALNRAPEARSHFQTAIALSPQMAESHFYYGRWLRAQGEFDEAASELTKAIERNPHLFDARYALLALHAERKQWREVKTLSLETLKISPSDQVALKFRDMDSEHSSDGEPQFNVKLPSAQDLLGLSLRKYQMKDYEGCIAAARQALQINPRYAEAYNNIAAALAAQSHWDEAIAAAQQALRLKPDFELARNNLAWAQSQKERHR